MLQEWNEQLCVLAKTVLRVLQLWPHSTCLKKFYMGGRDPASETQHISLRAFSRSMVLSLWVCKLTLSKWAYKKISYLKNFSLTTPTRQYTIITLIIPYIFFAHLMFLYCTILHCVCTLFCPRYWDFFFPSKTHLYSSNCVSWFSVVL